MFPSNAWMGMIPLITIVTTLVILLVTPANSATVNKNFNRTKVVLMSMDGFRYDYLNKTHLPNFDALISSGVKVPYVNNTFATWTFPCHTTIATGRYEESHGIVANKMYDPVLNETFTKSNTDSKWWDGAEPIWINAVKSGLRTGVFFWPGSETVHDGYRPTHWKHYNTDVSFEERVDTVIDKWLFEEDIPFAMIYFHEPDRTGHRFGPDSPEMVKTLMRMDTILGRFLSKLKEANLRDKVDFILTSDHGMANIDENSRLIGIREHVNDTLLHSVVIGGAVAHLRPQPGKDRELVKALSGIDHIEAFLKEDIPDHYYYKHHRRVMPVLLIAELGWQVRESLRSLWNDTGDHGYSSDRMEMKPIMIASGPSFKTGGVQVDPVKSVDIYPLLCHLLGIEPAPNNGSFERISSFLKENSHGSSSVVFRFSFTQMAIVVLVAFFLSKWQ